MQLKGWVERQSTRISREDLGLLIAEDPSFLLECGGEFYLEGNGCQARDHFGIMPGGIPAGTLLCEGKDTLFIDPPVPLLDLPSAIVTAVSLRADDGVVALSGGVDSALVASLAHLPAIAVGEEGSHDLRRAS
ncbi:MAG: asparagine synthase, partial [Methanomicrobiales archaeon]|nr:asparagine synthase [Methanomicrobiales archaeon]